MLILTRFDIRKEESNRLEILLRTLDQRAYAVGRFQDSKFALVNSCT